MLNHLTASLRWPGGRVVPFSGAGALPRGETHLRAFRLLDGLPVWRYQVGDVEIEKRVLMPHLHNTVHVTYRLLSGPPDVRLELRPSLHFRQIEGGLTLGADLRYELKARGLEFEIEAHDGHPPLRLTLQGGDGSFVYEGAVRREVFYAQDAERGYEARGDFWTPGFFSIGLGCDDAVTLIASTESWQAIRALDPEISLATERQRRQRLIGLAAPAARSGLAAELVLAADAFVISPVGRLKDAARARAAGDELRSIIAGYHWFTDWGRDTMISLEGLALTTGRYQEAAWVLRTFAEHVRDGLIPNLFPEGKNDGLYHTADATLWFFHALHRYVAVSGDTATLDSLLPVLRAIVTQHLKGTLFGIQVDRTDGLMRQGAEGYQLTWMDAKVDGWVVTPRRGKAVEINALWYNALRLTEAWLRERGETAEAEILAVSAERCREAFNRRFWNEKAQCLFDVVDGDGGDDPALRPNQLLALALEHPVLDRERWEPVLRIVEEKLLTPVGLRSLSADHPEYRAKYFGDLRSRDAAYHQGTVWAWLIGPFVNAWIRVHGNAAGARRFLEGFEAHLAEGCVGSISEVFDAEAPYTQRGCIAQAWSVAEVLRCLVLTAEENP